MENINKQSLDFVKSRVCVMKKYGKMLLGLGIQHFHYIKVFSDGRYIHLVDDEVYAEFYVQTVHDVSGNFINLHKEGYREYLWPQDNSDNLLVSLAHYNIANGFSITKFHEDYYEAWSFSTVPGHTNVANTYISYIDELKKFIIYFNNTAFCLLKEANDALARYKDYSLNYSDAWQKKDKDFYLDIPFVIDGQEIKISSREKECLAGISHGLSAKEVAKKLCITPRTVESYISSLKSKLNINTKSQAVCLYHSQQWIK